MARPESEHAHPVDPERVAHARSRLLSSDDAARLSGILSLLADSTRTRVIYALDLAEELCVGDIALTVELSEDAVGYALRILRTAGMVSRRKEGRTVYYRLSEGFPEPLRMHCLLRLIEISRASEKYDR